MKKSAPKPSKKEKAEPALTTAAKTIGSTLGKLAAQVGFTSEPAAQSRQNARKGDIQQQYYEDAKQQLAEARTLKGKWSSAPPAVQNHLDEIISVYEGIVGHYEAGQFVTQLPVEPTERGE